MRVTVPATGFTTQRDPWPKASAADPSSTEIVRIVARGGPGSTRQTAPATGSLTHTEPAPNATAARLAAGTSILAVTLFVRGSMRETVPSRPTTHTASPPTVRVLATSRRTTVTTLPVAGSILETVRSGLTTQTALRATPITLPPALSPNPVTTGPMRGSSILRVTAPDDGSSRDSVVIVDGRSVARWLPTHTAPAPTAMSFGIAPMPIDRT